MLPENPLTDGVVTLRPWQEADADWYVAQVGDPEIRRFTHEPAGLTALAVREAIEDMHATRAHAGLVITDAATGALLGNAGLAPGREPDTGRVAYWVAAPARGRGAATRAVRLLVAYAWSLGLRRLTLWAHEDNAASRKVAERAGFTYAGTDVEVVDGVRWPVARYTIDRPAD
jgi:[ribosomal protein S5]-alanine N-acetyltransferase